MTYDVSLPTKSLAGWHFARRTRRTRRTLESIGDRTTVFMGVPTYMPLMGWAEGLPTALRGVRRLDRRPSRPYGVGIDAEWTTDAREWARYRASGGTRPMRLQQTAWHDADRFSELLAEFAGWRIGRGGSGYWWAVRGNELIRTHQRVIQTSPDSSRPARVTRILRVTMCVVGAVATRTPERVAAVSSISVPVPHRPPPGGPRGRPDVPGRKPPRGCGTCGSTGRPWNGTVRSMAPSATSDAPFGRMLTAMVTPFRADGDVDYDGTARLATYLVDEQRCDGLVVSGTTGESPTTGDAEKERLLRTVIDAVGDHAVIVAGAGTNDTEHSRKLARQAEAAGADGLLLVTPYYNKPPQEGLLRHFTAVADVTGLPVMLYDIPGRTGVPIHTETLVRLAEHPRIVAVKDAKGDLFAGSQVMARTSLVFYSGDDALNLPWLAVGAAGFVSVVGHVVGADLHEMIDAYRAGDRERALAIHRRLLPVVTAIMTRTQGAIAVKAALNLLSLPGGAVRAPLVDASSEFVARLREDLTIGGVKVPEVTA
jgi:4-hydroxy-tetrahydrodipicolinate synthase